MASAPCTAPRVAPLHLPDALVPLLVKPLPSSPLTPTTPSAAAVAAPHSPTRRPRPALSIAIPPPSYYRTPTALRRVLKRLRAADALAFTPPPALAAPAAPPPQHVVVDISSPRAASEMRAHRAKHWFPPASLYPLPYILIALFFLTAAGLHWWPF